jgi:hypothetical protein
VGEAVASHGNTVSPGLAAGHAPKESMLALAMGENTTSPITNDNMSHGSPSLGLPSLLFKYPIIVFSSEKCSTRPKPSDVTTPSPTLRDKTHSPPWVCVRVLLEHIAAVQK